MVLNTRRASGKKTLQQWINFYSANWLSIQCIHNPYHNVFLEVFKWPVLHYDEGNTARGGGGGGQEAGTWEQWGQEVCGRWGKTGWEAEYPRVWGLREIHVGKKICNITSTICCNGKAYWCRGGNIRVQSWTREYKVRQAGNSDHPMLFKHNNLENILLTMQGACISSFSHPVNKLPVSFN